MPKTPLVCSQEENERWVQAAKHQGLPLHAWQRTVLNTHADIVLQRPCASYAQSK